MSDFRKRKKSKRRRRKRRTPDVRSGERLSSSAPAPTSTVKQAEEQKDISPTEIPIAFPILLASAEVTEDMFEEELFQYTWFPEEGYYRTVDLMIFTTREIVIAEADDFTLLGGEEVIVATKRGIEIARCLLPPRWRKIEGEIEVKVLRVAYASDKRQMQRNREKEMSAFNICDQFIKKLNLDMKLLRARYLHGGGRVIFYFTAKHRVDFRQLVKQLHAALHTKVELRQIGVRDAAKMMGGIGPCGKEVCCSRFLHCFKPVSIRMVKEQNMMTNPQKISGICGRLLCCLEYEHEVYSQLYYKLPDIGQEVKTPDGSGKVCDVGILEQKVKVQTAEGATKWWNLNEIKFELLKKREAVSEEDEEELDIPQVEF